MIHVVIPYADEVFAGFPLQNRTQKFRLILPFARDYRRLGIDQRAKMVHHQDYGQSIDGCAEDDGRAIIQHVVVYTGVLSFLRKALHSHTVPADQHAYIDATDVVAFEQVGFVISCCARKILEYR